MGDTDVAEPDRQQVAVGRLAGLADRHDHAAPIGVLAGDRRLDQRRIGDRQRDALGRARRSWRRSRSPRPACGRPRRRARPAAPATSAPGSSASRERREPRILEVGDAPAPRFAAAPVANSSSVSLVEVSLSTVTALKRLADACRKQRLQHGRGDRRVGCHERQHRRHVGRDHARALGDAVDRHVDVAELRPSRSRIFG